MVSNASLIYNEPPTAAPVPGKHLKKVTDSSYNPDSVKLDGGILVKVKVSNHASSITRRACIPPHLSRAGVEVAPT